MGHHTKEKGDLAVLKVQADLCEQGFAVCVPLTEHAPFDVVAFKGGKFISVQAKYCTPKNGVMAVDLRRSWADRNGSHSSPYSDGEFDILAIYCPDTGLCYYVDWDVCKHVETLSLRINPAKVGANRRFPMRMAKDFRQVVGA
jgi:hypothetical protein